jgi:hypothetical protein
VPSGKTCTTTPESEKGDTCDSLGQAASSATAILRAICRKRDGAQAGWLMNAALFTRMAQLRQVDNERCIYSPALA